MSLLSNAVLLGTAYNVSMNDVKFLQFGLNGLTSIGTSDLKGCSVVMIVSAQAAILAHIAPLPPNYDQSDREAGDRHCQRKMDEVGALYKANRQCFPTRQSSWVLCAVFRGEVGLPDQQNIMQKSLAGLGLRPSSLIYSIERQRNLLPSQGTVFIDGSKDDPIVYVEDKQVSKDNEWATPSGPSASYSNGATSGIPVSSYSTGATYTTGPSAYMSKTSISYSTWPSASQSGLPAPAGPAATVPADSPYVHDEDIYMFEKQGETYYRFTSDGKKLETMTAEWKQETVKHKGHIERCWAYTGKNSGTKFWRWSMESISTKGKGKGRGKGKGK